MRRARHDSPRRVDRLLSYVSARIAEHRGQAEPSVEPQTDTVGTRWLTWPAAAIAALAWVLGRVTHLAFFRLIVVAALAWLGGWLLTTFVGRTLLRNGQLHDVRGADDPHEDTAGQPPA